MSDYGTTPGYYFSFRNVTPANGGVIGCEVAVYKQLEKKDSDVNHCTLIGSIPLLVKTTESLHDLISRVNEETEKLIK